MFQGATLLSGFIPVKAITDPEKLAAHLAHCLKAKHATEVEVSGATVSFRISASPFAMTSTNVLAPFSSGQLTVNTKTGWIEYTLRITQLLTLATVFVGLTEILLVAYCCISTTPQWIFAAIWPLGWVWLVGVNLMTGLPRFEDFL